VRLRLFVGLHNQFVVGNLPQQLMFAHTKITLSLSYFFLIVHYSRNLAILCYWDNQ